MFHKKYFLHSASLEQSIVIKKIINKYLPECEVVSQVIEENYEHDKNLEYIHIPTGAASTEKLLQYRDITLGEITLASSSLRVFNKNWLLEQCLKSGGKVPTTWLQVGKITSYPIFYKQRYEQGGGERGVAFSPQDIPKKSLKSLIFQELIVSDGTYGVSFLADKGRLLVSHSHFESESLPKNGGSAVIIECFDDKRLFRHTEKLIKMIEYSGWGLAEYKYCPKRKDYVLMEINAKFWASCELAFVNEPLFLKKLFSIDSKEKPIKKMIFVDRALQRGILFIIKKVIFSSSNTKLRLYSGWLTRLLISMIPSGMYKKIKLFIKKTR